MQDPKQRLWKNTAYWIVPYSVLNLFSYTTRFGTAHNELSSPASIVNQKNATADWVTDQSDETNSSIGIPIFQMILPYAQLTKS